jgi:hypothetical protein
MRRKDKVRARRERLRRQGLRPTQTCIPDIRSPSFKTKAHRQSLAVARSSQAAANQTLVDAISEWSGSMRQDE